MLTSTRFLVRRVPVANAFVVLGPPLSLRRPLLFSTNIDTSEEQQLHSKLDDLIARKGDGISRQLLQNNLFKGVDFPLVKQLLNADLPSNYVKDYISNNKSATLAAEVGVKSGEQTKASVEDMDAILQPNQALDYAVDLIDNDKWKSVGIGTMDLRIKKPDDNKTKADVRNTPQLPVDAVLTFATVTDGVHKHSSPDK